MNEQVYDINYTKVVRWWTPLPLRKTFWLTWLGVLVTPVARLYQSFVLFRQAKLYQLTITPQICYLEKLLNDRFDFSSRRIYIDDGIDRPPFYIYVAAELKPQYIRRKSENQPRFIYTSGESGDLRDDFIIWVPYLVDFDVAEMTALVKAYKLAGTKFKIEYF